MKKITRFLLAFFLIISQAQAQNNALDFDGSDNVTINHGTNSLSGTFTFEFWAKPSALGPDGFLGSRSPGDNSLDIQLTASGGLHGDIGNGSGWLTTSADASGAGLQVGVWSHIAYVITPTGYTIYVDGVQKGSGSYSGTPLAFDNNHTLILGAVNAGGSQPYHGALDELRIWSTARTQIEIQNNMNLELSSGTGLVVAYHFNQGTAGGDNTSITTLTDATGTFDGTLNGFTLTGSTSNFVSGFTALPVELTAFTATSLEKSVLLNWQTASELNNEGFEIQHSPDGRNWQVLGFVQGNGTTVEEQQYSFLHRSPHAGDNYYRLRQLDFDGAVDFSKTIIVFMQDGRGKPRIFPTITDGVLMIENKGEEAFQIAVFSINGQRMMTAGQATQLDVSFLEAGMYLVQMTLGADIFIEKIIKH